jgi:hypothetical protein
MPDTTPLGRTTVVLTPIPKSPVLVEMAQRVAAAGTAIPR